MIALRAGRDDLQPLEIQLFGIDRDVIGDDDQLRVGSAVRVEPQAAGAASDD